MIWISCKFLTMAGCVFKPVSSIRIDGEEEGVGQVVQPFHNPDRAVDGKVMNTYVTKPRRGAPSQSVELS